MSESSWWWLSFADPSLPTGSQFLGACIVRGSNIVMAALEAHRLKISPGGQVLGISFAEHGKTPAAGYTNRLLTRAECEEFDRVMAQREAIGGCE